MDPVTGVKIAVYRFFAETGRAPSVAETAARAALAGDAVPPAYAALRAQRLLVLEPDGTTIRMAPPFSGVPTAHVVESGGVRYFGNCAWDALGVIAALGREGRVLSTCAHTGAPLDLPMTLAAPADSAWRFHCLVPAAKWWADVVFT
jgi:hypothetical protein